MADIKTTTPAPVVPNLAAPGSGVTWYMDAEDALVLVESWKEYIKANRRASLASFVKAEIGKDIVVTQLPEDPSSTPEGSQLRFIGWCDTVYITINPCVLCHQKLLAYRQFFAEFLDLAGNVGRGDPVTPAALDGRPRFFFLFAPAAKCVC